MKLNKWAVALMLALVLCLTASMALAAGEFKIGNNSYDTLALAYKAAQSGDTIVMTANVTGPSMAFGSTSSETRTEEIYPRNENLTKGTNITVDFGGYTYSFNAGAGSSGTESNGFQLLSTGPDVTLKNGTLKVASGSESNYYTILQNYTNLTVTDMVIDGTGLDKWSKHEDQVANGDSYAVSNNSGKVLINGNTTILGNDEGSKPNALSADKYDNYSEPTVVVETTGTISGKVVVTTQSSNNMVIKSGNFTDLTVEKYIVASDGYRFENGKLIVGIPAVSYVAPKTGDNSNVMLWAALMALSVLGMVAASKKRMAADR